MYRRQDLDATPSHQRLRSLSVRIRLGADVSHRLFNCDLLATVSSNLVLRGFTAVNCIRLLIRNLNTEFFLNRHHDLHCIQAVETEIVREVGVSIDLEVLIDILREITGVCHTFEASVTCSILVTRFMVHLN